MLRVITFIFVSILPFNSLAEKRESLWSENKDAEAVCINGHEDSNSCFVIIGRLTVDITSVENGNLGKLGLRPRSAYSRIISFPSKWLKASENEYMVNITTQAWFEGQRYTVSEPVYIRDGIYYRR